MYLGQLLQRPRPCLPTQRAQRLVIIPCRFARLRARGVGHEGHAAGERATRRATARRQPEQLLADAVDGGLAVFGEQFDELSFDEERALRAAARCEA